MRINGFAKPYSRDQVTSWVLQPLFIGSFVTFVVLLLSRDKCLAILLPNAVLVATVISSWTICESRNPAEPKPSTKCLPSCLRIPYKETRYCSFCCKSSPGLDHHCTWLNTCIAESNYASFYCLVVSATVQTLLQAVVGILMCTLWYAEVEANVRSGWHKPVVALLWVHNVGCVSLANSFFLLAGFHTYLLCVGTGTYDFILANGADGLCTRLLKCNCLRRGKKSKPKRSHVRDGDVTEAKSAEKAAPRSRRGSPPPGAVVVLTPPSPHAVGGRGETHSNAASGEQRDERHASMNPTEMVGRGRGSFVSASKQHMELSIGVNESEGIFEEIDLGPNQKAPTDTAEVPTTDL